MGRRIIRVFSEYSRVDRARCAQVVAREAPMEHADPSTIELEPRIVSLVLPPVEARDLHLILCVVLQNPPFGGSSDLMRRLVMDVFYARDARLG